MKRTEVINYIIKQLGLNTYLEIGTQTKAQNFDGVNIDEKYCVDKDPKSQADYIMSSDKFFSQNEAKYDLIFIDGDHSYAQSKKDVENALEHLTDKGIIIMHDTLPDNLEYTKPIWCGEAYKTALEMSAKYEVKTYNSDHGVSIIYPFNVKEEEVMMYSYDLDRLLSDLNASTKLEDLKPTEITIDKVVIEEEETSFDDLTDDEVKALYKEKTGKKRVASTVTREDMIEALS